MVDVIDQHEMYRFGESLRRKKKDRGGNKIAAAVRKE
jgi:hypothetical protein